MIATRYAISDGPPETAALPDAILLPVPSGARPRRPPASSAP